MSTTFTIAARLTADTAQFNRAMVGAQSTMGKLGNELSSMGNKMRNAGRMMTVMVTLPIAALGVTAVKAFSEFDDAMNQSLAIMGTVSDSMKNKMSSAAREMAKNSTFSAKEAADAFYFLASAGLNAQQSIAALPVVTRFAQSGMFNLEEATSMLMNSVSALGLKTKNSTQLMQNMTRVSDVLTKAAILSDGTVRQFAEALTSKAASALKTFHKSVEEGAAVLSVFADQGLKGKRAGEALTIVLQDISRAAARNTDGIWSKLNLEIFDSTGKMKNLADVVEVLETKIGGMSDVERALTLEQLGLTRSVGKFILQLMGTSDQIRNYQKVLEGAGGTTKDVAEKQLESFKSQLILVKNRIQDVFISIGAKLAPAMQDLAKNVAETFEWFGKLSTNTQKWVFYIGAALAVMGPLLIIVGSLLKVFAAFATISEVLGAKNLPLLVLKFGAIGIAIAAVTTAFVMLGGSLKDAIDIIKALAIAFAIIKIAGFITHIYQATAGLTVLNVSLITAAISAKGLEIALATMGKVGPLLLITAAIWAISKAFEDNQNQIEKAKQRAESYARAVDKINQAINKSDLTAQKGFYKNQVTILSNLKTAYDNLRKAQEDSVQVAFNNMATDKDRNKVILAQSDAYKELKTAVSIANTEFEKIGLTQKFKVPALESGNIINDMRTLTSEIQKQKENIVKINEDITAAEQATLAKREEQIANFQKFLVKINKAQMSPFATLFSADEQKAFEERMASFSDSLQENLLKAGDISTAFETVWDKNWEAIQKSAEEASKNTEESVTALKSDVAVSFDELASQLEEQFKAWVDFDNNMQKLRDLELNNFYLDQFKDMSEADVASIKTILEGSTEDHKIHVDKLNSLYKTFGKDHVKNAKETFSKSLIPVSAWEAKLQMAFSNALSVLSEFNQSEVMDQLTKGQGAAFDAITGMVTNYIAFVKNARDENLTFQSALGELMATYPELNAALMPYLSTLDSMKIKTGEVSEKTGNVTEALDLFKTNEPLYASAVQGLIDKYVLATAATDLASKTTKEKLIKQLEYLRDIAGPDAAKALQTIIDKLRGVDEHGKPKIEIQDNIDDFKTRWNKAFDEFTGILKVFGFEPGAIKALIDAVINESISSSNKKQTPTSGVIKRASGGYVGSGNAGFVASKPTLVGEGAAKEYVIPTETRYRKNAFSLLDELHKDLGINGMAKGGILGGQGLLDGSLQTISSTIGDILSNTSERLLEGLKSATSNQGMREKLQELIYSHAGTYIGGGTEKPIGQLSSITKGDHWDHVHAGVKEGYVWQIVSSFLQERGVPFKTISTDRPGAVTHASGRTSLHALGRAIDMQGPGGGNDVAGGMNIFNALLGTGVNLPSKGNSLPTGGNINWFTSGKISEFGGPGDFQPTAYDGHTRDLYNKGFPFAAMRNKDLANRWIAINKGGNIQKAQILDYGPATWTKRVVDVSPHVMNALGADTDDSVSVGTYDNGGYLKPGWNMAYNGTGAPEPVGGPSNVTVNVYATPHQSELEVAYAVKSVLQSMGN